MEILLAIVVAAAVIFFGALISMGNERQRKAMDGLREQVALWAVQDLKIKRERLGREIKVENPLAWLSTLASKVSQLNLDLEAGDLTVDEHALMYADRNSHRKVAFSRYSPTEIGRIGKMKRSRISKLDRQNDILGIVQKANAYHVSILNGGAFFDLELQMVWQTITRQGYGDHDSLWVYVEHS